MRITIEVRFDSDKRGRVAHGMMIERDDSTTADVVKMTLISDGRIFTVEREELIQALKAIGSAPR